MGFSDLLTSSRGPGVIGTLLALLVLVGFGTLYMFVFDEGLQGGKKTIAAVIRDQDMEIDSNKIQIENAKERLAAAEVAKAKAKEANELTSRNAVLTKQVEELTAAKTAATEAVAQAATDWEKYKDDYRASEWASAVGDKMPDIKTSSGEVFTGVEIKSVDHTGVRISHSGGAKTIKPEDLPSDLFDRFQFDLAKKKAMEDKEAEIFTGHTNNVEIANLAKSGQEKLARIDTLNQEIAKFGEAVETSKESVSRFQSAIDRKRMDIASEQSKIGGISRAPQMKEELKVMERKAKENRESIPLNNEKITKSQREISKLQGEIREIKGKIDAIKKAQAGGGQAPAPKN
jgi:predicted  nucleic acid-binding Zn-ribbon protein